MKRHERLCLRRFHLDRVFRSIPDRTRTCSLRLRRPTPGVYKRICDRELGRWVVGGVIPGVL